MRIFEQASRGKLRFPSSKGELTVEQLWDLPLQSKNGFDLDSVAKTVNTELKSMTEESFVSISINPASGVLALKLDVVKHIIAVRLAENEIVRQRTAKLAERAKLLDILADKQDEQLKALSPEEIKKRLEELA